MAKRATQERTLGAILGLGIGDALGMPVAGLDREEIASQFGSIEGYHARRFEDGAELNAGEFTDETEIAMCIMETYTSTMGTLDPELNRARMQFLAKGESRRWTSVETLRSLDDEAEDFYRSAEESDPEVALRGITVGLIHGGAQLDEDALRRDVATVVELTHNSPILVEKARVVAIAIANIISGRYDQTTILRSLASIESTPDMQRALQMAADSLEPGSIETWRDGEMAIEDPVDEMIVSAIIAFVKATRFEDAVFAAASAGGMADSRAALAGALAGSSLGAGGIPQVLIDQLEGRIYLTLAAPWFYRTAQMATGRGISMDASLD